MPFSALAPDELVTADNLTGTVADIDDSPDSPDGNKLANDGTGAGPSEMVAGFPTPPGELITGGAGQEFRWVQSKSAAGGNGVSWGLYLQWGESEELGTISSGSETSTTGTLREVGFNAGSLAAEYRDGSTVRMRVQQFAGHDGTANSRGLEIQAVEWYAQHEAGAHELAGDSTADGAATGALGVLRPVAGDATGEGVTTGAVTVAGEAHELAGDATGDATPFGALGVLRPVGGDATGDAVTNGALGVARGLVGDSTGVAMPSGALGVLRPVAGDATGDTITSGAVGVDRPLVGNATSDAVTAGALGVLRPVAGDATGDAVTSGAMAIAGLALAGDSMGVAMPSGALGVLRPVAGDATGLATPTGILTLPSDAELTDVIALTGVDASLVSSATAGTSKPLVSSATAGTSKPLVTSITGEG